MKPGKPLKILRCYEVAFSRSGSLLLTLSKDVVGWDVANRRKQFRVRPLSDPSHCAVHPDETQLVVKNTSGAIAVLDARDGKLVRMFDSPGVSEGSNLVYSACGEYIVDGSWDGLLTVRSSRDGSIAFQKHFANELISDICHDRDRRRWFVLHRPKSNSDKNLPPPAYVTVWAWPFTSPIDRIRGMENDVRTLAVAPDGAHVCVIGHDSVATIRVADKRVVASAPYEYGGTQFRAVWSPDGAQIATV